mmetsp:Transcript_11923/g.22327  ORF Transcript_11923/g.22327 Transcript_11923/m.22327 type:complete len:109 (+) Transcript_11923:984-1310(+)
MEREDESMDDDSGDEELEESDHDPFSEDSEMVMGGNKNNTRKKHEEEGEEDDISDEDTIVMGERNEREDEEHPEVYEKGTYSQEDDNGWKEVTRKHKKKQKAIFKTTY